MGVLLRKDRGIRTVTGIGRLTLVSFLAAISSSFIDTIWALYIDQFVNNQSLVGFISAGLTLIAFFSYFLFIPIIEKNDKSKLYGFTLLMFAVSYFLFWLNKNFYLFILLAFIVTILHTLRITSFGIMFRDKSAKSRLSENEGLLFTFTNVSWVIGPLIAGYLSERYNLNLVFLLSSFLVLLSFFLFRLSKVKDANILKNTDKNVIKNFFDFFRKKNRAVSYFIGGGTYLWHGFVYLFMPLHIIRSGLNNIWVGYFLFAVCLPLILCEYKFSKIAGKVGFKKMFKTGFLIIALFSLLSYFFSWNIYIVMSLLVLASFGVAMLEPTTEAYFFDILKDRKEEDRFYGPYNTTIETNLFIGKVSSSIILLFFPFKYLFLLFAFFMFVLFLACNFIRDVIEDKKK